MQKKHPIISKFALYALACVVIFTGPACTLSLLKTLEPFPSLGIRLQIVALDDVDHLLEHFLGATDDYFIGLEEGPDVLLRLTYLDRRRPPNPKATIEDANLTADEHQQGSLILYT